MWEINIKEVLGKKAMKVENTINLGQISGEMKTLNTFILIYKGL